MPTNRKRRSRKFKKSTISASLKHYFLTGNYCGLENCPDRGAVFLLGGKAGKLDEFRRLWEIYKEEILKEWIKKFPCTRPFAFWRLETEGRKQVAGSSSWELLGIAMDSEGLPRYWQYAWDKENGPVFESQCSFLDRNGFLTPAEKKYLKSHQELLEHEQIKFEGENNQ
jgi:hypothetical protein